MVFFITAASLRHRFGVTLIVSRHSERWQECLVGKTGNGNMTPSEESMALNDILPLSSPQGTDLSHSLRMTINVPPHYDAFSSNRHSERWQEWRMRKQGSGNMTRSEESITSMTFYRFPHHGDRFFAGALNDALPLSSPRQQILRCRSHEDA